MWVAWVLPIQQKARGLQMTKKRGVRGQIDF